MSGNVLNLDKRTSINGTLWNQRISNDLISEYFDEENKVNHILNIILSGRNVKVSESNDFLNPKVNEVINDPSDLLDLDIAVNEIVSAIVDNKKIGIIGDYDVDGTTSASLLTKFFNHYNVETSTYIPNRLKDGYGPNVEAFENFKNDEIDTVITVDKITLNYIGGHNIYLR